MSLLLIVPLFPVHAFASPGGETPPQQAGVFQPGFLFDENRKLAIVDGFVVTGADVNRLTEFMRSQGLEASPDEQVQGYLKVLLFSMEAEAMIAEGERARLGQPDGQAGTEAEAVDKVEQALAQMEPLQRMLLLSNIYWLRVLKEHPLKDVVFESFYVTYPNQFQRKDEETGEVVVAPLDNENTQSYIRAKVLEPKKEEMLASALARLKEEHHVRLCSEDSQDPCQEK